MTGPSGVTGGGGAGLSGGILATTGTDAAGQQRAGAEAGGAQQQFYFSRQFRAVSGASPSQFRQASRAERVSPLS